MIKTTVASSVIYESTAMKPVGPTFHRSFPLQRVVLSQYLKAVKKLGNDASVDAIRSETGLGTMKVPSAQGYGKATGLLTSRGELSLLGDLVLHQDGELSTAETMWLLHAGLVGGSTQAPPYWRRLWNSVSIGSVADRDELAATVRDSYDEALINLDSAKVSATAFTSTYLNSDGLGSLKLIRKSQDGIEGTTPEEPVTPGAFAYFLASAWSTSYGDQLTVGLDSFFKNSGVIEAFRISRAEAEALTESIARIGIIELYRTAPPYQIVRSWSAMSEVLAKVYGHAS